MKKVKFNFTRSEILELLKVLQQTRLRLFELNKKDMKEICVYRFFDSDNLYKKFVKKSESDFDKFTSLHFNTMQLLTLRYALLNRHFESIFLTDLFIKIDSKINPNIIILK